MNKWTLEAAPSGRAVFRQYQHGQQILGLPSLG